MTDIPGRQRLTKIQRQEVDKLVLNCRLSNLTVSQTKDVIAEKLNIHLSDDWITHIRMKFKSECKKQIKKLALDRYEHISLYMECIAQVDNIIAHFWEDHPKIQDPYQRIQCLDKVREPLVLKLDLIEHLPIIATANAYDFAETSGSETVATTTTTDQQQQSPTRF